MRPKNSPLMSVRRRLLAEGFGGLFYAGECACTLCDLAPCGTAERDDSGWINECEPGYLHVDPRPGQSKSWMISSQKSPMVAEDFQAIDELNI